MAKTPKPQEPSPEPVATAELQHAEPHVAVIGLVDFPDIPVPPAPIVDPDTGEMPALPKPPKVSTSLTAKEAKERDAAYLEAEQDAMKRDFTQKVMEARRPQEPVHTIPEVCSRVQEQTLAEMAAGRALNEHYAKLHASRQPAAPDKGDPTNVEVFRPDAYDEYKASFKNSAQSVDKGRGSQPLK